MSHLLLVIYILESIILGMVAFLLKKLRSKFPDVRVGYHTKHAMESNGVIFCFVDNFYREYFGNSYYSGETKILLEEGDQQ